jgi:predicted RNase H-like nuclease (RuvC/YqgF family)
MQQLAGNPLQAGPLNQNQENALLTDQFHLMNVAAEQQDENTARFLQSFQSFAAQILESNKALSDRIAVLEAEKAAASENAEKIIATHLDEVNALTNLIKTQAKQVNDLSNNLKETNVSIAKLQNDLINLEKRHADHTHNSPICVCDSPWQHHKSTTSGGPSC